MEQYYSGCFKNYFRSGNNFVQILAIISHYIRSLQHGSLCLFIQALKTETLVDKKSAIGASDINAPESC